MSGYTMCQVVSVESNAVASVSILRRPRMWRRELPLGHLTRVWPLQVQVRQRHDPRLGRRCSVLPPQAKVVGSALQPNATAASQCLSCWAIRR